ncbi:MAG: glucose-6-phosphate isomerase [Gemmatimonadetes bacterium]|nr:glucose-6-phosphate isomerase [Gemmatimonadota bacterium]MDA1103030.1 glucose-6-phosphate isomerase [Gemmatimonadota bacterium]
MNTIRFDYGNLLSSRVEGGIDERQLATSLADRFRAAHAAVEARRAQGDLGFLDLPYATESVDRVTELADGFAQWFQDVVVLGIGGSGLGATALKEALLGPFWNARDEEGREHFPRLHVVDNPDPHTFQRLLELLDPAGTMFNVISKSGTTAETMAQYLVARDWMESAVGQDKARGHFLFTTDPTRGALRQIGEAEDIPMLSVPENVGGRFSVLSAVGLLPAAVCGVDPRALLAGAAAMEERCRSDQLAENPAGLVAVLLHQADQELGRPIHVLMPYADRLRPVALWFQQLWAESLGKADSGPTPLAALGATDQHSLLQLLMEGPHDKVVLFIHVENPEAEVAIPQRHPEIPSLAYLGGHSMGELLSVERAATAEALRGAGRPNCTLIMPRIGGEELGQLLMLFQIATVYAGALYGVDPLDQPGVEVGKQLTYGLMGRVGVTRPEMLDPDSRWIV